MAEQIIEIHQRPLEASLSEHLQSGEEHDALQGETMELNMGPQHPCTHGVLRLVLELDGEIAIKVTPHLGYLHRGKEKLAEIMTYYQFLPYVDRLDYLAPLANDCCYIGAVEKLAGIEVTPRCAAIRVICCEMARVSAHLLGLGAFSMDIGAMSMFLYTFNERERIYDLIEMLTGARLTTSYPRVGGLSRDATPDFLRELQRFLNDFPAKIDEYEKLLTRNRIFVDRTQGIGVLSADRAIAMGVTGPCLRAAGVPMDLRKDRPYLNYEQYDFEVPIGTKGDSYDRYLVRMEEMRQSLRILQQAHDTIPSGPFNIDDPKVTLPPKDTVLTKMEELIHQFIVVTEGIETPSGEVYYSMENPKGELGFYIYSTGEKSPYRLKIRAPSFSNLALCDELMRGHMVADITAILGSLDFVMGEADR